MYWLVEVPWVLTLVRELLFVVPVARQNIVSDLLYIYYQYLRGRLRILHW